MRGAGRTPPHGGHDHRPHPAPTPADLVRLRTETDLALADIRTEVMRAEAAWRGRLAECHAKGRAAAEATELDTTLLSLVLEGLRASL
ncbi:hypothetical protein ACFV2N_35290 [Streptomyces sp. NPDC059680]|uniref:hypothetical protein n=1 Tax=Streptomyces TaxID=1883 RepID=UPI001E43A3A0|nr:hypothetical protein [Streptomyces barringtoniae]MCC5478400.1 hypothetical protein [Streptomyces barringtoniae]